MTPADALDALVDTVDSLRSITTGDRHIDALISKAQRILLEAENRTHNLVNPPTPK